MSSTLRIKRAALLAMAEFTAAAKDIVDANDYRAGITVRILPQEGRNGAVRLAASNRYVLAVCHLEAGDPEDNLVAAAEVGKSWETGGDEYILPILRILPAMKGNPEDLLTIEHLTYGKTADERRGKVTVIDDYGVTISTPTIPSLFRHMEAVTQVTRGHLQATEQVAVNPTQLMRFVRAAKRLGISNPERVVVAHTNGALGVKVGLANWLYGVVGAISAPGYGEGTAPGWLTDTPLTAEEEPQEVQQLALWGEEEQQDAPSPADDLSALSDEEVYQRYSNATNDDDLAKYAAEHNRRRAAKGSGEEVIQETDEADSEQRLDANANPTASPQEYFCRHCIHLVNDQCTIGGASIPVNQDEDYCSDLTLPEATPDPEAEPITVDTTDDEVIIRIPAGTTKTMSVDDFAQIGDLPVLLGRLGHSNLTEIRTVAEAGGHVTLCEMIDLELGKREAVEA